MKDKRADTQAISATSKPGPKIQKRSGRAKATSAAKSFGKKPGKDQIGAMLTVPLPLLQQQQTNIVASINSPLPEEIPLGFDGALELDGWCWDAVDEEKLLGWFPFVDEDFPCFWTENRGWSSGFFSEDYNDIWQLKHIHEIPSSANR